MKMKIKWIFNALDATAPTSSSLMLTVANSNCHDDIEYCVTGSVCQRSSQSIRQQSHDFVATETEVTTLVAPDDTAGGVDDDSTWESISHEVIPLTSSSS